jgi:hypothetical protein
MRNIIIAALIAVGLTACGKQDVSFEIKTWRNK